MKKDISKDFSAIILAGGKSSRMGESKAELSFHGIRLIDLQIKKLRSIGIENILVSGASGLSEDCPCIADIYPGRGPLSGLHACLKYAKRTHCVVLGVDIPLISRQTLLNLLDAHSRAILPVTVIGYNGMIEPLIAVYDRGLSVVAETLLQGEDTSMRSLLNMVGYSVYPFTGDTAEMMNCNTPQDYALLSGLKYNIGD